VQEHYKVKAVVKQTLLCHLKRKREEEKKRNLSFTCSVSSLRVKLPLNIHAIFPGCLVKFFGATLAGA